MALANAKLLDAGFAFSRTVAPRAPARDVVVIGIDVDDLRRFPEPRDFWHAHYGRLLGALAKAKPSVVGLDVVFPERSYQGLIPGLDEALLRGLIAMRAQAPVVLARTIDDFSNFREIFAPYVAMVGADAVGAVVVCKDEDEVIRRFDEYLCDPQRAEAVPSLAGLMAKRLGVAGRWRGWIDYRVGEPVQYLPFREAMRWADEDELRAAVQGRPVLVGFILPFEDRKTVPVDLARWEPGNRSVPGVLVHAQILRSLLNGGLLQSLPGWLTLALIAAGAGFSFLPSRPRSAALYALFIAGLAALAVALLRGGWVLAPAGPALAATLAMGARFTRDGLAHARERSTLRRAFGGYVSPQIMSEILAGRIQPGLSSRRERVCILFSDIRDFTTRSEFMAPEALIEMLNRYFTEMTQSVHEYGGTVDKFIGDGMMCFFGAPQPLERFAECAVAAGRDMLRRLDGLNAELTAQGVAPLAIGVGLHVGEVVVGHVGSDARHEYTVIGDAVNTASRIEGLTKKLGYPLVISRDVWLELAEPEAFTPLGEHPVKGRSSVQVYGYLGAQARAAA
jgi:adenylate cyclase